MNQTITTTVHGKFTELELEAQADKIMESFNFEKVWHHMNAVGHKWQQNGELRVPTLEEIQIFSRSLLTRVIYDKDHTSTCGSGGLMAYKLPWGLSLTFMLTWSNG